MPGTRGLYSINRDGAVRDNRTGDLRPVRRNIRDARAYVNLTAGSGTYSVARLLALTFMLNPRANYMHVHHKNGDPTDDRLDNLEWVTPSEHKKRHIALGTATRPHRKLQPEQVRELRHRAELGESVSALATEYGVVASTIVAAIERLTWRHVT